MEQLDHHQFRICRRIRSYLPRWYEARIANERRMPLFAHAFLCLIIFKPTKFRIGEVIVGAIKLRRV